MNFAGHAMVHGQIAHAWRPTDFILMYPAVFVRLYIAGSWLCFPRRVQNSKAGLGIDNLHTSV